MTNPAPTPVPRRWRQPRFAHALTIILAIVVVVFAAGDIYHYTTKSKGASAVVAAWTPNHTAFCGALSSLNKLGSNPKMDTNTEAVSLKAFEALSVNAPSKLVHTQFGAVAVAFGNLESDPSGLQAVTTQNISSTDPLVRAYVKAVTPLNSASSAADAALLACNATAANSSTAVAMVDAASLTAYATGSTSPITIAEVKASASSSAGSYTSITLDRLGVVKIVFASAPTICVTLPDAGSTPKVTTC